MTSATPAPGSAYCEKIDFERLRTRIRTRSSEPCSFVSFNYPKTTVKTTVDPTSGRTALLERSPANTAWLGKQRSTRWYFFIGEGVDSVFGITVIKDTSCLSSICTTARLRAYSSWFNH